MSDSGWPIIGVLGGNGGVGASTFAAGLAAAAGSGVLVDLDEQGGGIDVLLGLEGAPGARWSGLNLDGGTLDPDLLHAGLPSWRGAAVLACDRSVSTAPGAVAAVLDAASRLGPVVIDLGRAPTTHRDTALARCGLVVVVAGAEVGAMAATKASLRTIEPSAAAALGLVTRQGSIAAADVCSYLGLTHLGELPPRPGARTFGARIPRPVLRLGTAVLAGAVA